MTPGMMKAGKTMTDQRRWVVKIGSALLTDSGRGLDRAGIAAWVAQIAQLRQQGIDVVLVSSGAVAEGMLRLGWQQRPSQLSKLQAAAAVGQTSLVGLYEKCFGEQGLQTAQVLFTHDDISDRGRYLNARAALATLLSIGVVPIVNENDTVATDEIRYGDNDRLAALAANLVEADALVIMTDQEGLFTADPRSNPEAELIREAAADDPALDQVAGDGAGELGRGGMRTKLLAARWAARSGTRTHIVSGARADVLTDLAAGLSHGTLLTAGHERLAARKRWIADHQKSRGDLVLDDGAVQAVVDQGRSVLAVGVTAVKGRFSRGDAVRCVDALGGECARGLINYSSDEMARLVGTPSAKIANVLGYAMEPEVIHRNNLVLTKVENGAQKQ